MEVSRMSKKSSPIEHIIVLMMENRSYDHMLGFFPNGERLKGDEYNLVDPGDPSSEHVLVSDKSGYVTAVNPLHDVISIEREEYGEVGHIVHPAPMSGFVKVQIENAKGDVTEGKKIMQSFDPQKIPALSTLAREFVLCDHWCSSVPGPTWLNRFYVHAATSDGVSKDDPTHIYKMKTIFDLLYENGHTWNVYYGDIPQCIILQHGGDALGHFKRFDKYYEDLKKGHLADYSFIEPRFIVFHGLNATDQHPSHDVRLGEYLIAEVYDALRASSYWEKSLLIVLYDEHGGFYDHVPPPDDAVNPDGKVATDPPFDFTRLGVRVPAILVSPWVARGKIDATRYEHASIPATLRVMFDLPHARTRRDAAANTFEKNLNLEASRKDSPLSLPVPGKPREIRHHRSLLRANWFEQKLHILFSSSRRSKAPLTLYQQSLVGLADRLNAEGNVDIPSRTGKIEIEHEAALHIHKSLRRYMKNKKR